MCGRSYAVRGAGLGPRRRRGDFFGLETEKLGPRARVTVSLSVLAPVALSGVLLVIFVPNLWWIFTTYFWVAFPALGLLASGLSGAGGERAGRAAAEDPERELLRLLSERGPLTAAEAAAETSLTVAEADRRLKELAEAGHLEVGARGGGVFYALWEAAETAPGVR